MGKESSEKTPFIKRLGRGIRAVFAWLKRHLAAVIAVCVILLLAGGVGLALGLTLPLKSLEVEGEVLLLQGEKYSSGLSLRATTKAGLVHEEEVLPDMISGFDPDVAGEQEVTVRYGRHCAKATIRVLAPSEVDLRVREGTLPSEYEPNDPFPTSGIFDLYYGGECIRSAPITRSSAPGFTSRLSGKYDVFLNYKALSAAYSYTVLEIISSITPEGILYAPQGVALSSANTVGNMRFLVKYKDGTEEYLTINDERVSFRGDVLEKTGADYGGMITLSYKGIEITCPVTAYGGDLLAPKSVALEIDRTVYKQGETFDYSSAVLKVVFERFGEAPLSLRATQGSIFLAEWQGDPNSEDYRVVAVSDGGEPILFDLVKNYTLIASYNSLQSAPITVRVVSEEDADRITDLVTTWRGTKSGPLKKGQDLDFDGAKVAVVYGFGYRETELSLTAEMVSGYDKTKAGDQTLTVTYEDFEKLFDVRVADPGSKEVTSIIGISGWDAPTLYSSDELVVPETAYLEAEIGYGGSENRKVYLKDNPDVTISGFTPHRAEAQTLTIAYAGLEIKQRILVQDDRTEDVIDFWAPNDIYYDVGEELDLSGRCFVFYSTGKQVSLTLAEVLEMGGRITPEDFDLSSLVPGDDYAIRIFYPGFNWSDHFTWIHVRGEAPVTVKGIRLEVDSGKTTYKVGDELDITGMKLYLTYSNHEEEEITENLNTSMFTNFSTGVKGDFTATVTYFIEEGSFITKYDYTVE